VGDPVHAIQCEASTLDRRTPGNDVEFVHKPIQFLSSLGVRFIGLLWQSSEDAGVEYDPRPVLRFLDFVSAVHRFPQESLAFMREFYSRDASTQREPLAQRRAHELAGERDNLLQVSVLDTFGVTENRVAKLDRLAIQSHRHKARLSSENAHFQGQ